MPSSTTLFLVFIGSVTLCLLCSGCPAPRASRAAEQDRRLTATLGAPDYASELASLEAHIQSLESRATQRGESWPDLEALANAHRRHAMLSGDFASYVKAQQAMEQAFAVAPSGSGPFLSRASLNFSMHRLSEVEDDLQAAEKAIMVDADTRASIAALRADVLFYRGHYAEAQRLFSAALKYGGSIDSLGRIAEFHRQLGRPKEALLAIDEAERMLAQDYGQTLAWLNLQRGNIALDRGDHGSAAAAYAKAEAALPGWWFTEEHRLRLAEQLGTVNIAAWEELARQTGQPEYLDHLAQLNDRRGQHSEAHRLIEQARAIYDARLAQFPEAMYGHALDHYLAFEGDTEAVVDLARKNYAIRPGGLAQIKLAEALFRAGDYDEARQVIETTLDSDYRCPLAHVVAEQLYSRLGRNDLAEAQQKALISLNYHHEAAANFGGHYH